MIWQLFAVLILCLFILGIYFYKTHKRFEKNNPDNDKYIWVGPGEDPFNKH